MKARTLSETPRETLTTSAVRTTDAIRAYLKEWRETGKPPLPDEGERPSLVDPFHYMLSIVHAARTVHRQARSAGVDRAKLDRLDAEIRKLVDATEAIAAASRLLRAAAERARRGTDSG